MQSTVGQKLEEARKRLGLSLREAAEATKVRGDVLLHFETNNFQFDLPEVYKRGFLRLYARLLKLDTQAIMQEYIAIQTQNGQPQRARISHETLKRELFGHIHLDENETTEEVTTNNEDPFSDESTHELNQGKPKLKLSRTGIIILTALTISILTTIAGIVIFSQTNSDPVPANMASAVKTIKEDITLIATGDVYVVVRQENNREKLFSGPLKKGESIHLQKEGPIKIQHTQGENLLLEKNGHRYAMSTNGLAVSQFN